jgi:hypothetical protein
VQERIIVRKTGGFYIHFVFADRSGAGKLIFTGFLSRVVASLFKKYSEVNICFFKNITFCEGGI